MQGAESHSYDKKTGQQRVLFMKLFRKDFEQLFTIAQAVIQDSTLLRCLKNIILRLLT